MSNPALITFSVPDMECAACVRAITEAVHRVDAEAEVSADLATKRVAVRAVQPVDFARAIADAGFNPVATG